MSSLQYKTFSNILWALLQKAGSRGISFFVIIILARLLTPDEFGLIGMLTIFIEVSNVLVNAGFNQALIQKQETTEDDYSSVFYLNLFVGAFLYVIIFLTAPLIAKFYHQQELVALTRVLSLVFIVNAFSYIQETRLVKGMEFKTLTIIQVPSTLIGGILGIVMAMLGFGAWSIVALQLASRFCYTIQIWLYGRWIPRLVFNRRSVIGLFSFGSKLMIASVIQRIYENIYLVVIGRFFPLSSVGYYQNANNLIRYPVTTLTSALNSVTFTAFSSIQNETVRLKAGFIQVIQQLLFLLCPAFVLSGVLAVPLFSLVFTDKWLSAVIFFQILCVVGVFYPLNFYNSNILNIKGRSDIFLRIEVLKKLVTTIGIILIIPFGLLPLVVFQAVSTVFEYFLNIFFAGKIINYSPAEQLKDISIILLVNCFVGFVVWIIDKAIIMESDYLRLTVGFGVGLLLYWVIAWQLRLQPYLGLLKLIKTKVGLLTREQL